MLNLKAEALNIRDCRLRIDADNIVERRERYPASARAHRAETAEVESRHYVGRRVLGRREYDGVTLDAIVADPVSATKYGLGIAENIQRKPDRRTHLDSRIVHSASE